MALKQWRRQWRWLAASVLVCIVSCERTPASGEATGGVGPDRSSGGARDAGPDAAAPREDAAAPQGGAGAMRPAFGGDAGVWFPQLEETTLCALHVAAECDGAEDCDGGVCCAQFDPASFSYTRIACAERCEETNQFALCHPQQPCSANGSLVCRRSLIIPHEFIGVCVAAGSPGLEPAGNVSTGTIRCGESACEVGRERCCLSAAFDLRTARGIELEPRCIAQGEDCDCELALDAGDDAGVATP